MSYAQLPKIYGMMAEFEKPSELIAACEKARESGFRKMDAYSPFAVTGLSDALGFRRSKVALITLLGGLFGCFGGFYMQYWISAVNYPINSGGRPYNSWPSFIPVTFEMTILAAAISAVLGMLALNGLPRPHHPVFNVERFALASRDRFFLCIEACDPKFDPDTTRGFLEGLHAKHVTEVPY
jgi:Alternative complex III, ActD subunit